MNSAIRPLKSALSFTRRYMGIKEEIEPDDYQVIRDLYVTNQIWNVGDLVEANNIIGTIIE